MQFPTQKFKGSRYRFSVKVPHKGCRERFTGSRDRFYTGVKRFQVVAPHQVQRCHSKVPEKSSIFGHRGLNCNIKALNFKVPQEGST